MGWFPDGAGCGELVEMEVAVPLPNRCVLRSLECRSLARSYDASIVLAPVGDAISEPFAAARLMVRL